MLYNSVPDNDAKASFDSTCTPLFDQFSDISVTVQDMCDTLRLQKKAMFWTKYIPVVNSGFTSVCFLQIAWDIITYLLKLWTSL